VAADVSLVTLTRNLSAARSSAALDKCDAENEACRWGAESNGVDIGFGCEVAKNLKIFDFRLIAARPL
jgi:hypothetical protein